MPVDKIPWYRKFSIETIKTEYSSGFGFVIVKKVGHPIFEDVRYYEIGFRFLRYNYHLIFNPNKKMWD